jgi:hypothetical protein
LLKSLEAWARRHDNPKILSDAYLITKLFDLIPEKKKPDKPDSPRRSGLRAMGGPDLMQRWIKALQEATAPPNKNVQDPCFISPRLKNQIASIPKSSN